MKKDTKAFKKAIWAYYRKSGRDLPWRNTKNPYHILVSEIMLQQTQVSRVIPKYQAFLTSFPTVESLAEAKRSDVLREWHGLGYNRRALNLKRTAEIIVEKFGGKFPNDREALEELPGIGQSTSGALLAFAFDKPAAFIETNIRAVFIYFFFKNISQVHDKDIAALVEETIDKKRPREWYYALYDYGAMLKEKLGKDRTKLHAQSKHYGKQSKFEGSNRQIRANIISLFLADSGKKKVTLGPEKIAALLMKPAGAVQKNLSALEKEGFLKRMPAGSRQKTGGQEHMTFRLHA